MNSFLFGNHERQPSATSCSTSPCFVLAFSACLLSQPKTRLLHGCLPSKNTFPSHPFQHDHLSNKHVSHGNYIYTQKDLLGNHIDWLSRDVFHSDKSTPFCHFPVVEIPHRGELRLACVQPSVRPRTILRLCPTFATVRLWVGPVSYTRNCVSSAAAVVLGHIGRTEEVSRGHHGSPAPANRPGGRAAGIFCQKIVDTCLRARTILRFLRCVRSTTGNAHCVWSRGKVSGHHHYAGPPLPVRYASNCTPACLQQPALRDALYRLS